MKNRIKNYSLKKENNFLSLTQLAPYKDRFSEKPNLEVFAIILKPNDNQAVQTNFFEKIWSSYKKEDQKMLEVSVKGVTIIEKSKFKEVFGGLGDGDVFLWLMENLALETEFNDRSL